MNCIFADYSNMKIFFFKLDNNQRTPDIRNCYAKKINDENDKKKLLRGKLQLLLPYLSNENRPCPCQNFNLSR